MTGGENLVVNLREFDCFTFVENMVVLAVLIKTGECSFDDYAALLERSRYRDGVVAGYASRLHYFSEWLSDSEKKGIIKDVTQEMGGKRCVRKIHYMTSHRDNYPPLHSESVCEAMHAVERNLSEKPFYCIPKEELPWIRGAVKGGDIIAATTDVEGLDVVHVGMAACLDREIHLLHASDIEKKVVISDAALPEYLSSRKTMTGIMVGRIRQG